MPCFPCLPNTPSQKEEMYDTGTKKEYAENHPDLFIIVNEIETLREKYNQQTGTPSGFWQYFAKHHPDLHEGFIKFIERNQENPATSISPASTTEALLAKQQKSSSHK